MIKVTFVQKAVILNPQNKNEFLLLVRNKNDKSRPGDFDIPGGSLKNGESHEQALKREVLEETGLEVVDIKPVLVNSNYDENTDSYFIYIGYKALATSNNVIINTDEHEKYLWITLQDFKNITTEHILLKQLTAAMI